MSEPRSARGFRLSGGDAVVLGAGAAVTWAAWGDPPYFALLIAVVLGHFFLFCNVFRIGTRLELGWTAVFAVNFTVWLVSGAFAWAGVLAVQAPVTIAIITYAVRQPGYHGVFSRASVRRSPSARPNES